MLPVRVLPPLLAAFSASVIRILFALGVLPVNACSIVVAVDGTGACGLKCQGGTPYHYKSLFNFEARPMSKNLGRSLLWRAQSFKGT